jgi:methyl acetate hydrolase
MLILPGRTLVHCRPAGQTAQRRGILAQKGNAMPSEEIDALLEAAAQSGRVPGVVALAADASGTCYQGVFGKRSLADDSAMTLDTVFRIASMTKAVTAVAAMQCVEQGKLALDQPAGEILPELAAPRVLEGFDAGGKPILRPARRPITLRHLLTHTAGFVYPVWNPLLNRYIEATNTPTIMSGRLAALDQPLLFEPGERWEYGINIDWAGRMVEAVSDLDLDAYMRKRIFTPLGMHDTGFVPNAGQSARMVQVHVRKPDLSLEPIAPEPPSAGREFFSGGGGLFSTGPDYLRFLRMVLNGGTLDGGRILRPETMALMGQNHIGELEVQLLPTGMPSVSNDAEFFPGMTKKWGLSWFINTADVPGARSAGSLAWGGLFNTYYWIDPKQQLSGVLLTQVLPFADPTVLHLFDAFERAVYRTTTETTLNG